MGGRGGERWRVSMGEGGGRGRVGRESVFACRGGPARVGAGTPDGKARSGVPGRDPLH